MSHLASPSRVTPADGRACASWTPGPGGPFRYPGPRSRLDTLVRSKPPTEGRDLLALLREQTAEPSPPPPPDGSPWRPQRGLVLRLYTKPKPIHPDTLPQLLTWPTAARHKAP